MIKPISDFMIQILKFFADLTGGNYGLAIILLTAAIKIALYPLTLQSFQSMAALQKIQPKMQELQKKLKDQPQELQKKMMELYKDEKVNPFGGCLPMLLQMPFLFAIFFALRSPEFINLLSAPGVQKGFLWINDLALADVMRISMFGQSFNFYITAVLIGITTYWSQKTMPAGNQSQTGVLLYAMPVFIAFVSIGFPAGLQLYWLAQTVLGALQQMYISWRHI